MCIFFTTIFYLIYYIDSSLYNISTKRRIISNLNNDSSKYFVLIHRELSGLVLSLDPSNGNLNEAKDISFPTSSYTSLQILAGGLISNNLLIYTIAGTAPTTSIVAFINTDTWEAISFSADEGVYANTYNFSPLFNTDQIILAGSRSSDFYTLQTAYDKLHMTELYTQ